METLPDLEVVRTTLFACEYRTDSGVEDGSLGVMDVRFSPFNTWYRIDSMWEGSFLERTVPGAFKRTLDSANSSKSAHSIKTLFNHGMDPSIGDKLLGDVTDAREDADSPVTSVRLWDTSYNRDLLPGLRSGAYGSSFMFRVIQDEWNNEPGATDDNPDGLPERTIKEARVFEAGPVTFPASPTATAGMRSISGTDAWYEHLARREPARVELIRAKLSALRSDRPALGIRPAAGLANVVPTDPATRSHSVGLTPRERRERLHPYLKEGSHGVGSTAGTSR